MQTSLSLWQKVAAYNNFDVRGMVRDFSDEVVFRHVQQGETTMMLNGIEAFICQAETAKGYFSERRQQITSYAHRESQTLITIDYVAVLAIDFPNGMKKGQEIRMSGKSVFTFKDNKIIGLTDEG
ncbi:nuclear transport factor 2 family protein [Rhodoflexus sp.]